MTVPIAGRIAPLRGRVELGPSVKLGVMTQEQTGLDLSLTPLQTMAAAFDNDTDVSAPDSEIFKIGQSK